MGSAETFPRRRTPTCTATPRASRAVSTATRRTPSGGGVCAGIGRYFDIDPVWVRLGLFLPLLFSCFGWIPFLHWFSPMFGNLFGIFLICYFIMWFAVPAARTARQKLEMNGEKITAQTIGETTAAAASNDPDARAKPIVAEAVSLFGQVVLILLKIIAGVLVFGLIMAACALIIGLFAVIVGGSELLSPAFLQEMTLWVPVLGIFAVLIPVILLIYVLMCLIASRKPAAARPCWRSSFCGWLRSSPARRSPSTRTSGERIRHKRAAFREALRQEIVIDDSITTLEELLENYDEESVVREGRKALHISVPSKSLDITLDKQQGELKVNSDGREVVALKAQTGEKDGRRPSRSSVGRCGKHRRTGRFGCNGIETIHRSEGRPRMPPLFFAETRKSLSLGGFVFNE